jgi:hypothetical protein
MPHRALCQAYRLVQQSVKITFCRVAVMELRRHVATRANVGDVQGGQAGGERAVLSSACGQPEAH